MSSMESLDRLQAELQGNVNPSAYDRLHNLTQLASIEHGELMAQAMKWVRKEKIEPLEAENAKLRELVLRFRNYTAKCTNYTHNFGYGDCALGPFPDGGGCGNCRHVMCGDMYRNDLDKQLRELGVEVDDGAE